ncbi:hypothetical protein LCGC14_2083310 [marine sediment metagenome]|uniref:Uncharacterized protein n=1 Tax=marine sediment metagenome TaxID=412755 RepID=A0A0F9HBZ0_9ZZZZ|nr:hypothetical protein [Phycisphaerales bacterium]
MGIFNRIVWTAIIALTVFIVIDGMVESHTENSDPNFVTGSSDFKFVPEPNLIWKFADAEVLKFDWSTVRTTGDYTIINDSGCEIDIKTDSVPWVIVGDPNCYGDAIKVLLLTIIRQQESSDFWRKNNQKILTDAHQTTRVSIKIAEDLIVIAEELVIRNEALVGITKEQIIELAAEISEDVVKEIVGITKELSATDSKQ